MRLWLPLLLALAVCASPALAQNGLSLGGPFSDGMIIQRGQAVPVWGKAESGSTVTIALGAETVETVAAADGNWRVDLAPREAATGVSLTVRAATEQIEVSDIAFGDVFLCSGQSNMAWKMSASALRPEDRNPVIDKLIRLLTVPSISSQVEEGQLGAAARWVSASEGWLDFSAVCLFMGRSLAESGGVPVGLVNSSWGGTPIEAWMPLEALAAVGGLDDHVALLQKYRRDRGSAEVEHGTVLSDLWEGRPNPLRRVKGKEGYANLFNGMIAPLGPTRFAGAVWYQGENNANNAAGTARYRALLEALIGSWRQRSGGHLPFVVVQLAGYGKLGSLPDNDDWADVREAQRLVARADPDTELVVTIDVSERLDIHPPIKKPIGRRAAAAIRKLAFGDADAYRPPEALGARRMKDQVDIAISTGRSPLYAASWGRPGPFLLCADTTALDCRFADATFSGEGIRVAVPGGFKPATVRYCWDAAPICNVFDQDEIPLGPFELTIE